LTSASGVNVFKKKSRTLRLFFFFAAGGPRLEVATILVKQAAQ